MSPHINGWTGSQFADVPFSPPLDCMALPEDPPPYSEVAVDGQVSLLRGCSPVKQELDGGHEHTLEPWRTPPTTIQGPDSNMEIEEAGITHSFSSDDHNVSLHEEAAHPTGLGYFPQCPELYNPAAVFPSYSRSVSVDGLPLAPHRRSSSSSVHSTTFFPPRQDSALPLEPSHPPHPPSLAPLHHFQGARIYPTPPTFPSHPLTRPTFPSHPLTPPTFPSHPLTPPTFPSHPLTPPTFPSHPLTPPQLHYNGSLHPHMRLPPLQHQTKWRRKRRRGHTWHGEVPAMHMQDTTQQCS